MISRYLKNWEDGHYLKKLQSRNLALEISRVDSSFIHLDGENAVILFWDPNCGSCLLQLSELDSLSLSLTPQVRFYAVTPYLEESINNAKALETIAEVSGVTLIFQTEDNKILKVFNFVQSIKPTNQFWEVPLVLVLNKDGGTEILLTGYSKETRNSLFQVLEKLNTHSAS